jgi:hypothetical protein
VLKKWNSNPDKFRGRKNWTLTQIWMNRAQDSAPKKHQSGSGSAQQPQVAREQGRGGGLIRAGVEQPVGLVGQQSQVAREQGRGSGRIGAGVEQRGIFFHISPFLNIF